MDILEGMKKIAVTVCSGVCDGMELLKDNPEITGKETLVGYSVIGKEKEKQIVTNTSEKVILGENDLIV